MAILSAVRQNTDVESKTPDENSPMVLPPSNVQNRSTTVSEADYLGIKKKAITPGKTQGFFKSFVAGDDPNDDVTPTTAGKVGDVLGSVLRVPINSVVNAGFELWSDDVKEFRRQNEILRQTDPELAARMEYESGFGKAKTKREIVTQAGAGIAELALTLVPIGMLGKAGRLAWSAKEAAALNKLGSAGQYAARGLQAGSTLGQRVTAASVTSAAYGGMYGFLAGLQQGGDWEQAIKNVPIYSLGGAAIGAAIPGGLGASSFIAGKAFGAAKGAGSFVAKHAPESIKPGKYFAMLPGSLQRAILTEGAYFRTNFGEVGERVVSKFNKARFAASQEIGKFQDDAARLGLIDAPQVARGGYKEFSSLRERWKSNRDFRFAVRDALTHEGIFADDAVRAETLSRDKHMADIVEFFDKYRKDRGLLAQQQGITDNLLDIEKYFSKYTPQIGLSRSTFKKLKSAISDAELESIYRSNSDVVDDMVEYGFRTGQWKTRLEGFRSYYDAMDAALNLGRVSDDNNAYFKWMVENGHAKSLAYARRQFITDLDNMQQPLTPRTASLDYQRKAPMPWSDPDPMRVMSYYVKKADERIALAQEFGVNDEVLKDVKKMISASNQGYVAADDFEKAVRSVTGQIARMPREQRFSAMVRAIETFHLAFSQIINVSTLLNYVISADLKHLGRGFKRAFEIEGMRESVRRGVFITDMIQQTSPYNNLGDKVVDRFLKGSGFTYTEMLNRSTGVGVSKSWAEYNVNRAIAKMGQELPEAERTRGLELLQKKDEAQRLVRERGYKNTGVYAREFAAKFPDEEFAPVAGNIGLAEKRLSGLEESITPKIKKLQATRKVLEKKLLKEGTPLTDEDVMDLQETINILRESIDIYKGGSAKAGSATPSPSVTVDEYEEAIDGVVRLRRSQMEKMIEGLEDQFDEMRAVGQVEPVPVPAKKPLTPEQKVVSYNKQIKDIDDAIVSLQNELADKERLLNGIIDAYKIAEIQIRKSNPEGFLYDDFIKEQRGKLGEIPAEEAANLRELGLDPEEVLARGGLSENEYIGAAQRMVESTQGSNNPLVMPGMARTPMGKIFYQFKNFAYMQAGFIQKSFVKDLVSKDTRSVYNAMKFLTTVGVLYPITYGALRDVRDIVTLKKSPEDAFELEEYFQGLGLFSAGGLFVDFLKSAEQGGTEGFILGPGIGDVIKYIEAGADLATGDFDSGFEQLRKQLLAQTGFGRILNNVID